MKHKSRLLLGNTQWISLGCSIESLQCRNLDCGIKERVKELFKRAFVFNDQSTFSCMSGFISTMIGFYTPQIITPRNSRHWGCKVNVVPDSRVHNENFSHENEKSMLQKNWHCWTLEFMIAFHTGDLDYGISYNYRKTLRASLEGFEW